MEADDIRDLFGAFGPVQVRAMFGGQGIYADGLMFALQARGTLYLKADAALAAQLVVRGSQPFSYETEKGTRTVRGYWRVPEAAMDDAEDLAGLARQALSVAQTAAAARPRKRRAVRTASEPQSAPSRAGSAKRGVAESSVAKRGVAKSGASKGAVAKTGRGKTLASKTPASETAAPKTAVIKTPAAKTSASRTRPPKSPRRPRGA